MLNFFQLKRVYSQKPLVKQILNQTGFEIPATGEVFPSLQKDMKHEFSNKTSIIIVLGKPRGIKPVKIKSV